MTSLNDIGTAGRILFKVPLSLLQGDRFQPTGFPGLGAAVYETAGGTKLLVESTQSMANRLEGVCWDFIGNKPVAELDGISHVTVNRKGKFLTDSMLEAHRLNSPYILENNSSSAKDFKKHLVQVLGSSEKGPVDVSALAAGVFRHDVGSLVHGVFFSKSDISGGRLRISRLLSACIEARGVRIAASGGVKNDHVDPSGDTQKGFGNVPFPRDDYTSEEVHLFASIDLTLLRSYRLGSAKENLIFLLALHRLRKFLDSPMRLRTHCDLEAAGLPDDWCTRPRDFRLPSLAELENAVVSALRPLASEMENVRLTFDEEFKESKKEKAKKASGGEDQERIGEEDDEGVSDI